MACIHSLGGVSTRMGFLIQCPICRGDFRDGSAYTATSGVAFPPGHHLYEFDGPNSLSISAMKGRWKSRGSDGGRLDQPFIKAQAPTRERFLTDCKESRNERGNARVFSAAESRTFTGTTLRALTRSLRSSSRSI